MLLDLSSGNSLHRDKAPANMNRLLRSGLRSLRLSGQEGRERSGRDRLGHPEHFDFDPRILHQVVDRTASLRLLDDCR